MEHKGYTLDDTVDLSGRPVLSSTTGKRKACIFILAYQAFERFAYFGVSANLVIYMTSELHKDLVSAVTSVNNWSGTAWITPIVGAYIADSHLGRFWTITFALLIYAMGMGLLVLTTSLKCFRPTCTDGICKEASTVQLTLYYLSIYTIAIGSGVLKPNMSTFGADQFDDFRPKEKVLKVSYFNWWSFNTAFGTLAATLFVVYIQERFGWGLGYGISAVGFLVASVTFFMGVPIYRHKSRKGKSHAKEFFSVPVVAFRNRKLQLPSSPSELHECEMQHYIDRGRRQIYHTPRFSQICVFKVLRQGCYKTRENRCLKSPMHSDSSREKQACSRDAWNMATNYNPKQLLGSGSNRVCQARHNNGKEPGPQLPNTSSLPVEFCGGHHSHLCPHLRMLLRTVHASKNRPSQRNQNASQDCHRSCHPNHGSCSHVCCGNSKNESHKGETHNWCKRSSSNEHILVVASTCSTWSCKHIPYGWIARILL
ncbi:protein NRT1/ PTR FAMILY 5.1-like isoform X2 [Glycine soja]|uniref:protein NRT1/ PTR FAMILY 5.1-like isoform X2 n=1 Tax=Glycine soja TaxID=3848 RepID=UPI001039EF2F|nr:protein NRT1/ PTR FAMILY 5.1-like isoform X2 [Glycine soja]